MNFKLRPADCLHVTGPLKPRISREEARALKELYRKSPGSYSQWTRGSMGGTRQRGLQGVQDLLA